MDENWYQETLFYEFLQELKNVTINYQNLIVIMCDLIFILLLAVIVAFVIMGLVHLVVKLVSYLTS